jgi:hypothetical protein
MKAGPTDPKPQIAIPKLALIDSREELDNFDESAAAHLHAPNLRPDFSRLAQLEAKTYPVLSRTCDTSLAAAKLIPADKISPGQFLTPPEYGYTGNTDFNQYMGKEALEVATSNPLLLTPDSLKQHLLNIAMMRRELAIRAGQPLTTEYGKPVEHANPKAFSMDTLAPNSRHGAYTSKAQERYKRFSVSSEAGLKSFGRINIAGQITKLSYVGPSYQFLGTLEIYHPINSDAIQIKNYAIEKLSEALSNESWDLDQIAQSYRLLCHGTPYVNGSPSIVETLLDGLFRSRGWALPQKISEPFWDAIFHDDDEDGPYTWAKFRRNFTPLPTE